MDRRESNLIVQEQRVLSRLDELDDPVAFHSSGDYAPAAHEASVESVPSVDFEEFDRIVREFDFSLPVEPSGT